MSLSGELLLVKNTEMVIGFIPSWYEAHGMVESCCEGLRALRSGRASPTETCGPFFSLKTVFIGEREGKVSYLGYCFAFNCLPSLSEFPPCTKTVRLRRTLLECFEPINTCFSHIFLSTGLA